MNRPASLILALVLTAATAATSACGPACSMETGAPAVRAASSCCTGTSPRCSAGQTCGDRHITCGCTMCRQGPMDTRRALGRGTRGTFHAPATAAAVASLADPPGNPPTIPRGFDGNFLSKPDLPFISSVVLLI